MDILYYTNYDNRNYRQNEYNINQYNIYSQYNNNLKISSYDDDPFYNNAKKERRLSLTNIFSFVINNSKNKENVSIIEI